MRLHLLGSGGLALLRQKNSVDVGDHTSRSDGYITKEFVQLLIVTNGQLDVARDDSLPLVVTRGIASQLEDLSRKVLQDRCEVNGGTSTKAGGISSLSQLSVDTSDRELVRKRGFQNTIKQCRCSRINR